MYMYIYIYVCIYICIYVYMYIVNIQPNVTEHSTLLHSIQWSRAAGATIAHPLPLVRHGSRVGGRINAGKRNRDSQGILVCDLLYWDLGVGPPHIHIGSGAAGLPRYPLIWHLFLFWGIVPLNCTVVLFKFSVLQVQHRTASDSEPCRLRMGPRKQEIREGHPTEVDHSPHFPGHRFRSLTPTPRT